jgi:hypothetical protein
MPESTGETTTPQIPGAVAAMLEKHGFEVSEKGMQDFDRAFDSYKVDLPKFKDGAKEKDTLAQKLAEYEKREKEKADAEKTEAQKAKELADERARLLEAKDAEITKLQRDRVMDAVLFESLKDKPLTGIRRQLYEAAASREQWDTADDLKAIYKNIDKTLEDDLKASRVTVPAPGDSGGGGSAGGGDTKYDESYFAQQEARMRGKAAR